MRDLTQSHLCVSVLTQGSHPDHWYTGIREIRATNSTTIHTTGCKAENRCVCLSSSPSWQYFTPLALCLQ